MPPGDENSETSLKSHFTRLAAQTARHSTPIGPEPLSECFAHEEEPKTVSRDRLLRVSLAAGRRATPAEVADAIRGEMINL